MAVEPEAMSSTPLSGQKVKCHICSPEHNKSRDQLQTLAEMEGLTIT